jgi:hypothetical protein
VWLVAGNKGGVGKSVVAKSLTDWLQKEEVPLMVVEGDTRTPDVRAAFGGILPTKKFDLTDAPSWDEYSDFLCQTDFNGHIVTNLPDAISDRLILCFSNLKVLAGNYGIHLKLLFVINTLPDGLHLLDKLTDVFGEIYIVKNLYFGAPHEFVTFDSNQSRIEQFKDKVILFPQMNPKIMMLVRGEQMSFNMFLAQTGDKESNTIYAKLVVSDWQDAMHEALEDVLQGG